LGIPRIGRIAGMSGTLGNGARRPTGTTRAACTTSR